MRSELPRASVLVLALVLAFSLSLALGLQGCAHHSRSNASGGRLESAGGAAAAAVPPATRADIATALGRLEAAVNARDLDAALAVFAPDSLLRQETRARWAGPLQLDSLRCHERLGVIFVHGDTAQAVVCEEACWSEHGRAQADFGWRTFGFVRRDDRWMLVSDRERNYAQARSTDLGIELHPEEGTLAGQARIVVGITAPGEDNVLLGLNRGLGVERIEAPDGRPIPFTRIANQIAVALTGPAAARVDAASVASDSIAFTIHFGGSFFNEKQEQGYSQVGIGPAGSFASWVTDWYPRVRGPGSKSRGRITYDVPAGVTVASSGRAATMTEEGGRSRQTFQIDAPLDFSFAAARYFHASKTVSGVDLRVYFLQGGDAKADLYISNCARILAFLHGVYGSYPFDGYAVVEVPPDAVGMLGGSSEQGMNLFPAGGLPDSEFPLPLLAHEIGHSWWGNLVSGEGAPILDEGLAQMTAVLCVEEIAGTRTMRRFLRRGLPRYSQSAHEYFRRFAAGTEGDLPLRTLAAGSDNISALHDLADVKGFFVYEMLRETIGNEPFTRGLRAAVSGYARQVIHLNDLQRLWEKESGRDLGWFFDQWFGRTGAPEFLLKCTTTPAPGGRFVVEGTVTQLQDLYRVTAEVALVNAGRAARVETLAVPNRDTPFRFAVDARPDTVLFDPDYKILRWTDEDRNIGLLVAAKSLHSRGATDSATVKLAEYLSRAPASLGGHCTSGLWKLEAGDLAGAERELRWVMERARLYDFDDAAVARSAIGLGKIADLRHRREEAVQWYRQAAARPDETGTQAEATALLSVPFTRKPKSTADPELLQRCVGKYAMEPGWSITVALGKSGTLLATSSNGQSFGLELAEGARFRAVGAEDVSFEFGAGDSRYTELTVIASGRTFHLRRKE